jgi:hypothetical protein
MLLGFLGVMGIVGGLITFWTNKGSGDWLSTSGTIVSSRIEKVRVRRETYHQPRVEYEFIVDNQLYTSTNIGAGDGVRTGNMEGLLKHYHKGKRVTVYYDPIAPGRATLQRPSVDFVLGPILLAFIGALMLAGAIFLFIRAGY